jgi:hypothetical protein
MTHTYTTAAQDAATIRQALKAKGITSRDVSVRAESFSMGSAIRVVIKSPRVALGLVETIANQHESIDRCPITGDILAGGNRYVSVNYDRDTVKIMADRYLAAVNDAAVELVKAGDNSLIPVAGTFYMIGRGRHGSGIAVWTMAGHLMEANDTNGAAEIIAVDANR